MTSARTRRDRRRLERGQVVVIFAGAIIAFVGLMAIVIDVSWYWTSTIRMQRAADAAALAGVVYLPGNPGLAIATARAEAVKNGYANGVGGVAVTPVQDPSNSRRLHVTVSGPVNTYFARVVGLTSLNASRDSKADFVLPVPMGSPENYYGVGILKGTNVTYTDNHNTSGTGNSTLRVATTTPAGVWTANSGTVITAVNADDANYARTATNNVDQQWGAFGLLSALAANQTVYSVDGIQVQITDAYVSATCANSMIKASLSWDNGATWTSTVTQTGALPTSTTSGDFTLGSSTSLSAWGGHSWVGTDLSDTRFRLKLTSVKGCATAGLEIRMDMVQVRVYYHTDTVTTTTSVVADPTARAVTDPATGATLRPQGFWGAVITKGGERGNGDRYSPAFNGNPTANVEYDSRGYDYTIEVGVGGKVDIYDATYCATGANTSSGFYGTGDHWIGTAGRPVSTVYTIYNINSTPLDLTDDTAVITSGSLFLNETAADYSGNYGQPAGWSGVGTGTYTNCGSNPYHNRWWQMATGLAAGTYRFNVTTSSSGNDTTSAENLWSIWVSGGAKPRIYGGGKMAAYTNLEAGTQAFYLAQIDKVHAGKTMVIELFDPGDISGNGFLRILNPDGNAYNYATFSYVSDNGRSGNNVTQVQTAASGSSYFNNAVLTIQIPLPQTYGSGGLTPTGETEAGWWKIEYQVGGGNDTTTWAVSIRGNPVHLVLP